MTLRVSRFAPAPTGFLHLGHVVNAIYVWGVTRAAGGRVLLRIEDHDRGRSRPEFERAILDDLDWLGFVPDSPSTDAFRAGPCPGRQSDRGAVYDEALARLRTAGLVYACDCSRSATRLGGSERTHPTSRGEARTQVEDVGPVLSDPPGEPPELWYPGLCREKGLEERPGRGIRLRLDPSAERFVDLRHGPQVQRPSEQCGDLLARDRDGSWTYQFAVTVDDLAQGVTLVVRGDDLLASTGRQIQLARLLGRSEPPRFLHHPLVMKTPAQKLSKADRDTSVRDLRAAGRSAADIIGQAAHATGLTERVGPLPAGRVSELSAWSRLTG